jgi:hypothetical protein
MQFSFRFQNIILILLLSFDGMSALASDGLMQRFDANTEYIIRHEGRGFLLKIFVSKYQFFPDMEGIAESCRSSANSIADEKALEIKAKGKLNLSSRIETSRNAMGISSCVATGIFQAASPDIDPETFAKTPVYSAAVQKAADCDVAAATLYSATNNEDARTIAEAVCAKCSKEWDQARNIANQLAVKHNIQPGGFLTHDFCVKQNTHVVIELRAKRALTPTKPNISPRPAHKDRTI